MSTVNLEEYLFYLWTSKTPPIKYLMELLRDLLTEGVYVIGFFFPVVPKGEARIRVQISAAHTKAQLDTAIAAFIKIGKKYGVIS